MTMVAAKSPKRRARKIKNTYDKIKKGVLFVIMGYELHKNAIITNNVNFFCLACDSFLETKQEAYGHVDSSNHCEKLRLAPYPDKYKEHYIRKLKKGYYCAFCNVLIPTVIKVDSHICQEIHKQNRGNILLKSTGRKIIAYDSVLIKESAWHGLNENVCSICDAEFEDEVNHRRDITHILNLIQKSVKFGTNDAIYRHVDESTIHCLTCDKMLSLKTVDAHFNAVEHLNLYETCKIKANYAATSIESESNNNETKAIDNSIPSIVRHNDNEWQDIVKNISNSLERYKSKNIDIIFETSMAFCRKCWIAIEFHHHEIDKHIAKHSMDTNVEPIRYPTDPNKESYSTNSEKNKDNSKGDAKETAKRQVNVTNINCDCTNINSSGNESDSVNNEFDTKVSPEIEKPATPTQKEFGDKSENISLPSTSKISDKTSEIKSNIDDANKIAKDNAITFNINNANAFCRVCQVRLPSTLKSIKEHVKGAQHNKNWTKNAQTTKKEKVKGLKKISTKTFIHTFDTVENPFHCDFIINRDILISDFSFFLLADNDNTNILKCLLCKMNILYIPILYKRAIQHHLNLHKSVFNEIPVIKSVKSEFIREISHGEFHCGFCNVLITGWNEMESHLQSSNHKEKKALHYIRLGILRNLL